jgi:hypothetical protein
MPDTIRMVTIPPMVSILDLLLSEPEANSVESMQTITRPFRSNERAMIEPA